MTDRAPSGITIVGADRVEAGRATRGRSSTRSREDALLGHQLDVAGCLDTFGLTGAATVDVPAATGPCALLVQDLTTGRWRWELGERNDGGDRRFELDAAPTDDAPAGGGAGATAKLFVKILRGVGDGLGGDAGRLLVERWERAHRASTLRWHWDRAGLHRAEGPRADDLRGRSLLLLHDLFGTTDSGFARVPGDPAWLAAYEGRVWGFDHATLGPSPAANAARLIELLGAPGEDCTIDVLAHGRGGLVAAALALDPLRRWRLGTVVLAGVPVLGTPLCAPDQLVALADRYTNLLSLHPDNPVTTTFDAVIALVMQLAQDGSGRLDGIAAMAAGCDPSSFADAEAEHHLVGRFEPSGRLAARLEDPALDGLLGPVHDLFVAVASAGAAMVDRADAKEVVAHHRALLTDVDGGAAVAAWFGSERTVRPIEPGPGPSRAQPDGPSATRAARRFAVVPQTPVASRPALAPLDVRVVHGAIENVADIALVGHYLGTELTGTEAALDARLGGRLAVRHLQRLHPERPDEWYYEEQADHARPRGVMVVGLGEPGALTRARLTTTLTNALVRHGLELGERATEPLTVSLSSALIGSAEAATTSLPVQISVAAIVDAVLQANAQLADLSGHGQPLAGSTVTYDSLALVELYADKAEVAVRCLRDIDQFIDAPSDAVALADQRRYLDVGQGGRPARLAADDEPSWQRVVVKGTDAIGVGHAPELAFTTIGGRALTTQHTIRPNPAVLDQLLRDATTQDMARAAVLLFEMLVPVDLRNEIAMSDNLQLIVDDLSARYPWEALIAGRGVTTAALSRRGGLIRQFHENEKGSRERPLNIGTHLALVVGNPPSGDAQLPWLSNAMAEAEAVQRQLEGYGYQVTTLVPPRLSPERSAVEIMSAVVSGAHRILHVAGHGVVVDGDPDRTGVVIGPGAVLRAEDIEQRTGAAEFVFLNCCDLGSNPGLAANLARAFMSAGARAVVAAAWPVEDEPASWFARSLYGKLLSGSTFGAAVRTARLEAYRADPGSSTWAAYQCYGDPGFRLERRRRGVQRAPEIVSRSELDRQIRVISLQAADAGRPGDVLHEVVRRRLRDELVDLVDWADAERSSWLDAAVYHQLGFAASEVGALDHAVAWYRAALDSGKAHAPIEAVEQLGNMEIRLAQQLHRAGEPERVASLVAASRHHLIGALRLGRTVERHGLLGSHFKKRATMTSGAERRRLLERAAEQYGLGAARNRAVSYTVFNALQLDHLLGRDVAERRSCIDELDHEGEPSYWGLATHGDAMLTRLVLGDHVHAGVVSAYRHAFSYRSTWRERSSTLEHLRDLIDLTDGTELQLALIEVHEDLLEWLRTALGQED